MYFKKLELIGFKSFADKTVLHFEPGITAVVGPNGCGKCLHYDSFVTLSNGSNIKIGKLVEEALKQASSVEKLDDGLITTENPQNIGIFSLNLQTLKIEPKPVYAFIKRKAPEYLLEIKTKSGKAVIITHYHPLFSINDGQVINLKAEELKTGIKIITPRAITRKNSNSAINLFEVLRKFDYEDRMYIPYSQEVAEFLADVKSEYSTRSPAVKSALSGQAMNVASFMDLLDKRGVAEIPEFITLLKSRSSGTIKLPRQINAPIARFLGYLISEGRTTKENQVWFVNEDDNIVRDFVSCAASGFGVEAKVFNYKRNAQDALIFSAALCKFLEKAFDFKVSGYSKEKVIPEQLFCCEDGIIAEFLSALFEGDGYASVGRKGSGTYFEYASASEELAYGVSSLLLRLGVRSVVREKMKAATNTKEKKKRRYYSVFIYGLENVRLFSNLLNFVGEKVKKLEQIREVNLKTNPNLDLIPEVNQIFKSLVKLSGLKVKRFRKISSKLAAYYENRCFPSREGLLETLSIVAEHGNLIGLARPLYDYLKLLATSDIYWDEVISIKKIPSPEWVYDLSVPINHNFIAQDIVVHNSNIFDSIRWVLGEQSIKELRGSQAQDVIFNGSDVKEPLSMAEVTLTFDNTSKFFPVDHNEMAVTRRIFRSGESEYLLNKQLVRLKDILDLLMGTGIGAESYSLIQQGKIDLVLSAKPEDRRLVFDEASGITKYKAQKKEALRKLEETEQNLLRLNDIILEVKRQIGSLERQANKARKYREVFEELKSQEINLALYQKNNLNGLKDELIGKLGELELKESELLNTIREQESRISTRQHELKELENAIAEIRNQILNLENLSSRNSERINFNRERITELETRNGYLKTQKEQTKSRLILDEEKLKHLKDEYSQIQKNIDEKTILLKDKEVELSSLNCGIKTFLENITKSKRGILDLVTKITNVKNSVTDSLAKQQIHLARKKRLEIEKAKVNEEKAISEEDLNKVSQELETLEKSFSDLNLKILKINKELELEISSLNNINSDIQNLEKESLALQSQKDFLEKLKSKYEDIGESMNAVIYLDKLPPENMSGLVVKIKDLDPASFKLSGEAKPIDLDTDKITEKINQLQHKIDSLKVSAKTKQSHIENLNKDLVDTQQVLRSQEMILIDKKAIHKNTSEQFNKIKGEEEIIIMELSDVENELLLLGEKLTGLKGELSGLEIAQKDTEDLILKEQNNIALNNNLKEETLVIITRTKTEVEALTRRMSSDEATLKILEDTYNQDKESSLALEGQIKEAQSRSEFLESEIKDLEDKITQANIDLQSQGKLLKEKESQYAKITEDSSDVLGGIELERNELDALKNKLYELQMQNKDVDFKILSIKERISQVYKIDLDTVAAAPQEIDENKSLEDIRRLKEKLDSYGTVNLVAIEEYDELKKRYDFLTQQQNDLNNAKESLHNAILKINRTTKQMFLETFEKVRVEFRNYFRLLFNGGDAQLFLVDEHDPLESGIEIICRPPGKKLQNVLLLSGGEKSLSAIALIFAIFKVKPAPFCVLDEIDAALDEANIDRFARVLHEFTKTSQFVVITHNKRTIANADIMYGITMQESGISKIISVKFAQDKPVRDKEPEISAVAEPV